MAVRLCAEDDLESFLQEIIGTPINPPVLNPPSPYLDVQGLRPGPSGSISTLLIYILPQKKTYILDIAKMGAVAFTTPHRTEYTLRNIFESPAFPKVLFDVREAAAALFQPYGIRLAGVRDLQLLELATGSGGAYPKRCVSSLRSCIEGDLPPQRAEGVWGETVLQDPACLAELWALYTTRLDRSSISPGAAFWRMMVADATRARIRDAQGVGDHYNARNLGNPNNSPWSRAEIQERTEEWEDMMLDAAKKGDRHVELSYGVFTWK